MIGDHKGVLDRKEIQVHRAIKASRAKQGHLDKKASLVRKVGLDHLDLKGLQVNQDLKDLLDLQDQLVHLDHSVLPVQLEIEACPETKVVLEVLDQMGKWETKDRLAQPDL